MRYRWLCEATSCGALEVEVKVVTRDSARVKERASSVTIDRQRLANRGQLQFVCDSSTRSMVGIDFAVLTDKCKNLAPSICTMPHQTAVVGGQPSDCKPQLVSNCANGYNAIGLSQVDQSCAVAP